MVLLTSSAVSVIISSGIACTFTLALFLSGYVLQQKTVRSLQEAIRNPPPVQQYGPMPTLPPQFQTQEEKNASAYIEEDPLIHLVSVNTDAVMRDESQEPLGSSVHVGIGNSDRGEPTITQLWHAYIAQTLSEDTIIQPSDIDSRGTIKTIRSHESLAYLLIMNTPADLCSALLFTKTHRETSRLTPRPNIVFLYPATWDTSTETSHLAALEVLRQLQETYSITLHPVTMSRIWAGVAIESQLLADVQLTRWTYDRAMFVRPQGIIVDAAVMDQTLALSSIGESWQALPSTYRTASRPELLMYVNGLGLRAPRQDIKGMVFHALPDAIVTVEVKNAAYVIMDSNHDGALGERFHRDMREVCAGTGLLDNDDIGDRVGSG